MGLPPADLLAVARRTRSRTRRRTALVTAGVLGAVVLVVGLARVLGTAHGPDRTGHAATTPVTPVHPTVAGPLTRLVGQNGWVVRVPVAWGTDRVGCDGSTPTRPSVVFDHRVRHLPDTRPCTVRADVPYVRIGDLPFAGVPWRTVAGVRVETPRPASPATHCRTCGALRVPSAHITFEIHARSARQLRAVEDSLQHLSSRQITVPVWRSPAGDTRPSDQMTRVSLAEGLRAHVLEVPSRARPGVFLNSDPPLGTPVDLGRGITLFYSAGDLGRYADAASLRLHGWRLSAVSDFQPPYGRASALRAAGAGVRSDAFLRTLTITHEGPRHVLVQRRLAWLVVTRAGTSGGGLSTVVAVDATTGGVLETRTGFRGHAT